jgi:hypothetical protein
MTFDLSRKWSDTFYTYVSNVRSSLKWSVPSTVMTVCWFVPNSHSHHIEMTCSHSSRFWIALYMYEEDLVWEWSGWGVSIITVHSRWDSKRVSLPKVSESKYQGVAASLWPLATVEGDETLNIYKEDLLWVWTGWGASIIRLTDTHLLCQQHPLRVWQHPYDL